MFSWGFGFFRIDEIGISLWNYRLPFWTLFLLLLTYLICINSSPIKQFIRNVWEWLKSQVKRLWGKLSVLAKALWKITQNTIGQLLKRIKKRKSKKSQEEWENRLERQLFVVIIFSLSFLLVLLYKIVPEILGRNLATSPKANLMGGIVVIVFLALMFFNFYLAHKIKAKTLFLFIIFIGIWYWLYGLSERNQLATLPQYQNWIIASVILLILFLYPGWYKKDWEKPRLWIWFTALLMILLFIIGIALIDGVVGEKPLELRLNIEGNVSNRYEGNGTISCSSAFGKTYVGMNLSCTTQPTLNVSEAYVTFTSQTGDVNRKEMHDMRFTAPANTTSAYFEIIGLDLNNNTINVTTSSEYQFFSPDETRERNKEFIAYVLALIGAIFISIPAMMANFRQLSERSEDDDNNDSQKIKTRK